ncbi:hypothetical protein Ddye_023246 [Dipteronia dyeriana]|uniref:Uncharacterized protein n=1 Tax=Dipteronia dyeriana TaxID=168575 RepID=A0AAD9TTK4_9ROSI|nr:hypothetical protein Ddye_023246 [Dipteronia dyeriana]
MQATLKSELNKIRTKVDTLYAKFSSGGDNNLDTQLHKTPGQQNPMKDIYQNPSPNYPPPLPPSGQPFSTHKKQHPTLKLSSSNTQTLSGLEQTISKSIPSWMNAPSDPPLEDGNSPYRYDVPPVLIAHSLLDDDSLNDDTNQHESQSSNKRRFINTRSIAKRKPSRYKISLYIAGPGNMTTKYIYGPFRIGFPLNTYDEQLITYISSNKLPAHEVIVDIGHLHVTRNSFRTLEPSKFVDSEIINLIFEYKTINSKFKMSQLYWFLPTNYAYTVLTCTYGNQFALKKSLSRLRESYIYDLCRCKKMESFDIVLGDDILVAFLTTFSFTSFNISYAKAPSQPNGFDCGLPICMYMDDNCPTPLQMKSIC